MSKDKKYSHQIRADFGHKVKQKRLELRLSQEELAFDAEMHRNYVGSVERGERNISLENTCRF
jgi:transcriptional regulator with XRE-family HTH domain